VPLDSVHLGRALTVRTASIGVVFPAVAVTSDHKFDVLKHILNNCGG
jgi:hypothetical protein